MTEDKTILARSMFKDQRPQHTPPYKLILIIAAIAALAAALRWYT